jgi:hypothetical protein
MKLPAFAQLCFEKGRNRNPTGCEMQGRLVLLAAALGRKIMMPVAV